MISSIRPSVEKYVLTYSRLIAWLIATSATFGSLFSEYVLHEPPCLLCWWQRIFMYPLVVVLAVAIVKKDRAVSWYVLPLSLLGACAALFHYLLYIGIISEGYAPCVAGVSCTQKLPEYFGFLNLVLLSFLSFLAISILIGLYASLSKNE